MISDKIIKEVETKEKLTANLHKKLNKVTALKLEESTERANLMSSNLSDKIDGKVTEKAKVAYCDKVLKDKVHSIEWLENDIVKIKRRIDICEDKISAYKYMIRELELN